MQPLDSQHASLLEPVPSAARPQIQELLEDILRSVPFRTSRQCQNLFRYVVEHSIAGSDDSLRERVIGVEVFGRAADYDAAEDPVVRLRAADIRKRLAQYYQARENDLGGWKIEIPTGSYKAQFHRSEGSPSQLAIPAGVALPRRQPPVLSQADTLRSNARGLQRMLFWGVILLSGSLLAVLAGVVLTRTASPAKSAFDLFWEPILENSRTVLVCTGSNPVYLLSPQAQNRYKKTHSRGQDADPNLETFVPLEELKNLTAGDFLPVKNTYLTVGDASAIAQIASLLTSRHHAFDLRYGSDLSFGDLRQGPAILIGAFNNSWTLNMTDNLQFVFDSGDTPEMHVQDRSDPSRSWSPKISAGHVVEDYAIVSRVLDSKTGGILLTIAGLNHSGTRAAAEFATNPQLIAKVMNQAPKDWKGRNLQLVLHTNVVNDIPDAPTVVAARYW